MPGMAATRASAAVYGTRGGNSVDLASPAGGFCVLGVVTFFAWTIKLGRETAFPGPAKPCARAGSAANPKVRRHGTAMRAAAACKVRRLGRVLGMIMVDKYRPSGGSLRDPEQIGPARTKFNSNLKSTVKCWISPRCLHALFRSFCDTDHVAQDAKPRAPSHEFRALERGWRNQGRKVPVPSRLFNRS